MTIFTALHQTRRIVRSQSARTSILVAIALAVALLAAVFTIALVTVSAGSSPDEDACNGDHALESAGFFCTPIFNKGNPDRDNDGDVDIDDAMGEIFYKVSASENTITFYVNLFEGLSDTGLSEGKLCIDDDDDPVAGGIPVPSCTGGDAAKHTTIQSDGTFDPPLPGP